MWSAVERNFIGVKSKKANKNQEVAVAVLADWQLAKVTPDYNSSVCEERIERLEEENIETTNCLYELQNRLDMMNQNEYTLHSFSLGQ